MRGVEVSRPSRTLATKPGRALAALLLAGCVVVPLSFATALDDSFALPKLTALFTIFVIGVGLAAFAFARGQSSPRLVPAVDIPVLVFVVLNLLAWVRSADPSHSLLGERLQYQGLATVLAYVGSYWLARTCLRGERELLLLCGATVLGGTLVALYGLMQGAGLDPIAWRNTPGDRVFSSIGQPNALAAYLILPIFTSGALLAQSHAVQRAMLCLCFALMLIVLALTLSRGGYAGIMAGTILVAAFSAKRVRVSSRTALLAASSGSTICAVVFLIVLVAPARAKATEVWNRAASSGDLNEPSVRLHLDLWAVAARIAWDDPLLGTGQETFPQLFPRYRDVVLTPEHARALSSYRPESPHNVYLAIAAGTGIPALLAYLSFLSGCVYVLVKALTSRLTGSRRPALLGLLAALSGHAVTDNFMTAEITSSWLFWVLAAAAVAAASEGVDSDSRQSCADVREQLVASALQRPRGRKTAQ
jgi:O-antigen ligase